ncbi:MAG: NUDIX hydrolase [Candidatus Saccharimonadales bacterium]
MSELITLAGGVLLNDDHKILLLHRNTEALTQWEIPGGKVEPGENTEAAMRRELAEEIGVRVENARFLAQTAFGQAGKQYEYHWFEVTTPDVPRVMEPEVHDELHYFDLFRLRRMMPALSSQKTVLSPNVQAFCKQWNEGEFRLET